MIGKVIGSVIDIQKDKVLIQTSAGVAYWVYTPPSFGVLEGQNVAFFTYLVVREDNWQLFGFATKDERNFFETVLSINGVGPKTAYTIVNSLSFAQVLQAISTQDVKAFESIPGLGKKTAVKIVVELSQKLNKDVELKNLMDNKTPKTTPLTEALMSLGFRASELKEVVQAIDASLPLEKQIAHALKLLSTPHERN